MHFPHASPSVLVCTPIVVTKHWLRAAWGGKDLFHIIGYSLSRNSKQEPQGRNWNRDHMEWLLVCPHTLFYLFFSYRQTLLSQVWHYPQSSHSLIKKTLQGLSHMPIWWSAASQLGYPLPRWLQFMPSLHKLSQQTTSLAQKFDNRWEESHTSNRCSWLLFSILAIVFTLILKIRKRLFQHAVLSEFP